MKKIVRKNQIIITSLAILIAVAGYLNYTEKNVLKQTANDPSTKKTSQETTVAVNAENQGESLTDVGVDVQKEYVEDDLLKGNEDIQSNDSENEGNDAQSTNAEPGEAVLTNAGTFAANAKLNREQVRSKNKETLMNMINSANITEEQKNDITEQMLHITQVAQLENDVETLLAAKGFSDAVVSIGDNQVEVVLNMTDVSEAGRAQIEDVVKRKTNVSASNITITPITTEN